MTQIESFEAKKNGIFLSLPAIVLRYMRYSKLVISLLSHLAVMDDFLNSC